MKKCLAVQLLLAFIPAVQAADIAAGKAKVDAVCAVCHGANGVSVNETVPNLAAQRAGYIEAQLRALKEGSRRASVPTSPTATMAAIAAQLSPEEMANVAAYFASLPGAQPGAKSQLVDAVAKTHVTFPENYKATFVKYHTINFPGAKQVRHYYANPAALQAAREGRALPDGSVLFAEVYAAKLDAAGKPVTGDDGFFIGERLTGYTAMSRDAGWGNDIPEMLRNENWNYAVFAPDKQARTTVNQAECLACHKPLDKVSYTFTIKELVAAAKK